MSELLEFQGLKLSTDLNKFNNLMSELNVDSSILEKLETNISHTLLNAKTPLLAPFFLEEPPKMSSMKCREIYMIVWAFPRIFIVTPDSSPEEEPHKWKYRPGSTNKGANTQAFNSCHSKQVILLIILVGYAL